MNNQLAVLVLQGLETRTVFVTGLGQSRVHYLANINQTSAPFGVLCCTVAVTGCGRCNNLFHY